MTEFEQQVAAALGPILEGRISRREIAQDIAPRVAAALAAYVETRGLEEYRPAEMAFLTALREDPR